MKLQKMPITSKKIPIVKEWQKDSQQHDLTLGDGVGLVCGALSDGLEVIDVDCKYDLTGTLFHDFKVCMNEASPDLLKKFVVQKTVGGGYHLLYRCKEIAGNKKLALRETTPDEKNEVYKKEKAAGADHDKAKKTAEGDKVRVLIETRGEGGYVAIVPTEGYSLVYGTLEEIQEITPEEREIIFSCASQFNQIVKEFIPETRIEKIGKGSTPFDDYNKNGDVITELESHGWKIVGRKGAKILLLRPGQTTAQHSAYYDIEKNWFSVFSTSTVFNPEKAYLPYAVYTMLNCEGDFKKATKELYDKGYGDRIEKAIENSKSVPSIVNVYDNDLSFLATDKDYLDDLIKMKRGEFDLGLSTGFPKLDEHWLFKPANFVVVNGIDNVGKSTVVWYLALLSALFHNWKWIIYTSENSMKSFYRKMYEFYWCKRIQDLTNKEFAEAHLFVKEHFEVIKSDDELYNYKDILNMTKKTMNVKGYFDGLMIDPYNSLKIELTNSSKLSTHEYHYEAVSEMKLFGKQNKISMFINCHAVTFAARQKDSDGHASAPQKADTEGGAKFSNKADDFITIHRKTQSKELWMETEFHIRKIKEIETGGKVTSINEPVIIEMTNHLTGFQQRHAGTFINPVLNYHMNKNNEAPF